MDISAPNEEQKQSVEPVKQVISLGPPYPMVVLPVDGDFWMEGTYHVLSRDLEDRPIYPKIDMSRCTLTEENSALDYRKHFVGKEHMNFAGIDNKHGPILISVRFENDQYRVLLRLKNRTVDKVILPSSLPNEHPGPRDFMKNVLDESSVEVERFHHVCLPRVSEDIAKFDEHTLSNCYKVGVVTQKFGQTTEEEYLQNQGESPAFTEFLDLIGTKVELKNFPHYRGGLDVKYGQTGDHSYYANFKNRELMFHVSSLIPYAPKDLQQLGRKRHIGNDVVSIIFQEESTPFCPLSIRSHFLHVFIIIQVEEPNTENTRYKVSITSKEGVPKFTPTLPNPCIFKKGPEFRDFLLTKIVNAEMAAVKSEQFSKLSERTRTMLLESLATELITKSKKLLDEDSVAVQNNNNDDSSSKGSSILSSFRSAINRNNRSNSITSNGTTSGADATQNEFNGQYASLNDLSMLSTDQKREPKRPKKEKKPRKEKTSAVRSDNYSVQQNQLYSELENSEELSPVLKHPSHYRTDANHQPTSRCFTNQLFESESPTQSYSLPHRLDPSILNSHPVSPIKTMNTSTPEKLKKESNSESNSETEETSSLSCAQSEIEKLKTEIEKLKVDKMDLTRQNIFLREQRGESIGENNVVTPEVSSTAHTKTS